MEEGQALEQPEEVVEEPQEEVAEQTQEAPEEIVKYRFNVKDETGADVEVEMTPEEMQKGVMLERDYRRKTSEVAEQRKAVQRELDAKLETERKQYLDNLNLVNQALVRVVNSEFQGVDMNKLAEEDPAKYVQMSNRLTQFNQFITSLQQEQARVTEEAQRKSREEMGAKVSEAREILQRDIPGWGEQLYQDLRKHGLSYGFSQDEVDNVIDPRSFKVLHDAYQYRKLKEGKPTVDKKLSEAPKVLKPQKPVAKKEDLAGLRTQLKKTGSVDTFAELLMRKGM